AAMAGFPDVARHLVESRRHVNWHISQLSYIQGGDMEVKEVLQVKDSALFAVHPDSPLSEAVIMMAENDIGSVIVMDGGKLAGMLTFREVLAILAKRQTERRVGPTPPIAEILVLEAMDRTPQTAHPDMDVDELRRIMVDTHTRYVPVMEEETIVGIVSFHDVAKAVLEERNMENKLLKAYIKDWPSP
ncbi:CBS domain-containing protein, partial [Accumulibacter sp.]|uniref:CBS domain-containing protein n=1 Tax=Accumulibacter sp. TaxID=2053492 RepID=UPI00344E58FF